MYTRDVTEIRFWPFQMETTSLPHLTGSLPIIHPEKEFCTLDLNHSNVFVMKLGSLFTWYSLLADTTNCSVVHCFFSF